MSKAVELVVGIFLLVFGGVGFTYATRRRRLR